MHWTITKWSPAFVWQLSAHYIDLFTISSRQNLPTSSSCGKVKYRASPSIWLPHRKMFWTFGGENLTGTGQTLNGVWGGTWPVKQVLEKSFCLTSFCFRKDECLISGLFWTFAIKTQPVSSRRPAAEWSLHALRIYCYRRPGSWWT